MKILRTLTRTKPLPKLGQPKPDQGRNSNKGQPKRKGPPTPRIPKAPNPN